MVNNDLYHLKRNTASTGLNFTLMNNFCPLSFPPFLECGKQYHNKKNLVDHQKIKHQNILPYPCSECDKRFPSGSMMRTHIKNVHTRQKCEQCGIFISNKYWFRRHMVSAHGVKQDGALQCDFCPKLFFSTACKDRHTQTNHLNELSHQT